MLYRMNVYQRSIAAILVTLRREDVDPRHVEGYMRVAHGTLDALTLVGFREEVKLAVECVDEGGIDQADDLARSYGLLSRAA